MKSKGLVEGTSSGLRLASSGKEVYLKLREALPSLL